MAAHVQTRRGEIGIRMALGADARAVRRMVLGEGLRLTGLGVAIGAGVAVATARTLQSLLFEVDPLDPVSFLCAAGVLVAAALLACSLPARRAVRVDPVAALRNS
jgi:ABC-type antimicrobial peptide transport system permease subunit